MRPFLFLVLAVAMAAGGLAQDKAAEAWSRLARIQAYIEYFYMETGVYPPSLDDLEKILNADAPKGSRLIKLPMDPASNKPFRFLLEKDGKRYQLTVPEAAAYGGKGPIVTNVDWAFLSQLAERKRYEQMVLQAASQLKAVATQCELYAKDHSKQYPNTLDELLPKYIQRVPSDPLTGKNLAYKKTVDGYQILNPNPEKYGLKTLIYDSGSGLKAEPMERPKQPSTAPAPAETPTPSE